LRSGHRSAFGARINVRETSIFQNDLNMLRMFKTSFGKYSCLRKAEIMRLILRLVPLEGRTRRHLRGAGCDGRDGCARRTRPVADGEVVWSWLPDAGVKPAEDNSAGEGGKKARLTQESTKETVKTIARGKPDRSGWTCGDYTRVFFPREAAGAIGI